VPVPPTFFVPFTCSAGLAVVAEYPGWHAPHPTMTCGDRLCWPEVGAAGWHEAQVIDAPVQTGTAVVVPFVKLPWQYVAEQDWVVGL